MYDSIKNKNSIILWAEAVCYQNYGNMLSSIGKYQKALTIHKTSLKKYLKIEAEFKNKEISDLLGIKNSIAITTMLIGLDYKHLNDFVNYEKKVYSALHLIDSITIMDDDQLLAKSILFMNVGNLIKWGKILDPANSYNKEIDKMVEKKSFSTLNIENGELNNLIDNNKDAIPYYEKAIKIQEKLYKKNPKAYIERLAHSYINMARAIQVVNPDSSKTFFIKSTKLYMTLAEDYPIIYIPSIIGNLVDMRVNNFSVMFQFIEKYHDLKNEYSKQTLDSIWIADYKEDLKRNNILISALNMADNPCENLSSYVFNRIHSIYYMQEIALNDFYKVSSNPLILKEIGMLSFKKNDFSCSNQEKIDNAISAIEAFSKYEKYDRQKASAYLAYSYNRLAFYYIMDNNLKNAKDATKSGLKYEIFEKELNTNYAIISLLEKDLNRAIDNLKNNIDENYIEEIENKIIKLNNYDLTNKLFVEFNKELQKHKTKHSIVSELIKRAKKNKEIGDSIKHLENISIDTVKYYYNQSILFYDKALKKDRKTQYLYSLSFIYQRLNSLETKNYKIKVKNQRKSILLKEEVLKNVPDNQKIKTDLSSAYGNLSWYLLFDKQFDSAIIYAKEGIKLDKTQTWILTNLAHGYLLNGNYHKARKIYLEYKDKPYIENKNYKTFGEVFISDINELKKAEIHNENFEKILKELK